MKRGIEIAYTGSGGNGMKRLLLTNDDGIYAEGLIRLAETAKNFGEVWVVAPDSERSAASHSITLRDPIDVSPHDFPVAGVQAFSCSGTPGDCIRVGGLFVMPEKPYAVLSGINYGYNVATDVQYSATVGAAFEASFQGYRAIALSEGASPCHEVTDHYLQELLAELLEKEPLPDAIWNVNFPQCPLSECRGVLRGRTVSHGMVYRDTYHEVEKLPEGGVQLMVRGEYNEDAEEGTDFRAIVDYYVSVGTVKNVG